MNRSDHPSSIVAREELEKAWRRKLQEAQERYQVATERYNRLFEESRGLMPGVDSPLVLARHAQSAALDEYKRVARIFTSLLLNGQILEQESIGNGVRP